MNCKTLLTKPTVVSIIIGIVLLGLASAAYCEGTNRYAGAQFAPLDPKPVLAAAADITLDKYPDCDEAGVEKKMIRVYRADGTAECQDEDFTKVLTEKGKRGNRTLSLSFMLPYSTVQVVLLEVIKPGGEVVAVDVPANSKESIDDSQMQMNIYDPNERVLRVNIPGLAMGDVVHSLTRQTIERAIVPNEYSEESVFEGQAFIRHLSYEVQAPNNRPLQRIALRDEIAGSVRYFSNPGPDRTVIHHWEVTNVPRIFEEPSMPPYEMTLQRLFVSTINDWRSVSKWYWELSKPHLDVTTPELRKVVKDLTVGASSDLDKVKALFYNVSKKVRYMGLTPEKDRPGFEPHDVHITFDKKYGVCRDKAALLVSMLRAAGLRAYPVLINVGTKKDQEVPDPDFNHAIVSVELKAGEYILMDPTDENTRDLLPSGDCDQSYLVCRPEGEDIKISPIQPPEENLMTVQTTGTLSSGGHLDARIEIRCAGVNDDSYRSMLVSMKPDDRRRFIESNLKLAIPGARLKSLRFMPADMLDITQPVGAVLEFAADDLVACGSGKALVSLPWVGDQLGLLKYFLSSAGLEKRKYPMRTYSTCSLQERVHLKLGSAFDRALALPTCSPVEDDRIAYHQDCSFSRGSLDCSRELALKVVEFNPAEYLCLKGTLKRIDYDERKAPLLTDSATAASRHLDVPSSSGDQSVDSNARILESRKALEITDAHTSVYRVRYAKRILNYAGKIREAELKINFNPACQEAKLVRAVVTSKTGQRQEIAKGEINFMDAGWNASAKRYTGGKILVANLPGVDIGSTIEVEFEISSKNRLFLSGFESFQLADELERKSFQLTAPSTLEIQRMVTGPGGMLKEDCITNSDRRTFQWRTGREKALPAEAQLPPEWLYVPGVQYLVGDIKSYFKDLNQTMLDRSSQSTKAAGLAHKLAAAAKTKAEAAKGIRDFVAKSIREAGPSFTDLPLEELSAADTTLADGYGHAADRAILLHAMLAAAGFRPEFVLASGLPPIMAITNVALSFPLPHSFANPLVRVTVDGITLYLNDTDQYAKLGTTSHDGRMAIVLADQGSEVIHAATDCGEKSDTLYSLAIDDRGNARLSVTRRYFGTDYGHMNRYFSELPPEERRRYYQEVVSGVSQGARPVGDLLTHFETYPGLEEFIVEIDNYAVADGKYLYFDLPFTPSLFPAGADHRALPWFQSHGTERTVHTEIALPPAYHHIVMAPMPQTLTVLGGAGSAKVIVSNGEGKCIVSHDFETSPGIVDAKDYAQMVNAESALTRRSARLFLLEKDQQSSPQRVAGE